MTFRPIDSAITPGADAGASALSGNGGLSSGFAAEFSGTDLSQASQVFQAGTGDGGALAAKALSGLDISGISSAAATPLAGTEAAAFMPPTPGGEAALLAAANDPISPLVQLIMKLPGAMGIVNSFFEFLAAFFNPTNFLDFLNPMNLAQTAASAFQNLASHAPAFSLSMLPGNAPILNGMAQPMFSSDFLSAKLNMSIGNSSAYSSALAKPAIDVLPGGQSLNVGGELQAQQAVFETGGANGISVPQGHLSGPSLSDVGTSNHVAGNTRLFSDRMSGGSSFNSMNLAAKTPSPYGTPAAPTGISHGVGSNSIQGLNPGAAANSFQPASNFVSHARFEGAPNLGNVKEGFAPQAAQNVGYEATPSVAPQDVGFNAGQSAADASGVSYGPSGYVGRELGVAGSGNNNLIAMDQPVQSFRPTLSGADSQMRSAFPSNQQPGSPAATGSGQAGVGTGLKAKQLSLDSIADSAAAKPANVAANHGAQASKMASAPKSAETAMSKASAPTNNAADSVHKTVDAHKSVEAPAHKAASASHKTADSTAHKVAHKADAPAHKVSHAPAHKNAEVAQAPKSEVANQQQQLDANGNPADANNGMAADGSTVTDGTQIAQGDAAAATTQHYTVQKGDSLWNIAKNNLGDGSKWQEIYQLNQGSLGQNPDLIYPGTDLQLPGGAPEIANSGTSTMTNYTVKPGDNLWDISEEVLGKGDRWGELYQANQEIIGANPRLIHPGQSLNIPGAADPASAGVASAPDPNSMGIDPAAAGAQSAQPVAPQEISSGIDSVKSTASDMSAQQYAPQDLQAMPAAQAMPSAQAVPQAAPQTVSQAAAPEQLSYFEQSMNAAQAHAPAAASPSFHPTVASASRGLPVLPANNVPLEVGPGAAMAATPVNPAAAAAANHAQSAAAAATSTTKNGVVATEAFSHLKDLFGKSK